ASSIAATASAESDGATGSANAEGAAVTVAVGSGGLAAIAVVEADADAEGTSSGGGGDGAARVQPRTARRPRPPAQRAWWATSDSVARVSNPGAQARGLPARRASDAIEDRKWGGHRSALRRIRTCVHASRASFVAHARRARTAVRPERCLVERALEARSRE